MQWLSIRWRLTLWFGGVFALSLVIFSVVVYMSFARDLLGEVDRALDVELAEMSQEIERAPTEAVLQEQLQKNFGEIKAYELQVIRSDGSTFFSTPRVRDRQFNVEQASSIEIQRETARLKESPLPPFRVASRRAVGPVGQFVVQAAEPLEGYRHNLTELLLVLVALVPAVLAVALAAGYFLARSALAPVDRLTSAAEGITASQLDRRVDVPPVDDELGRLARTFNNMIAGLQKSFEEMRRFTADAAHELRTPLAVLKTEAEVALRQPRSPEAYREVLQAQLVEIERLTRLANQLLYLCREDSGLQPMTATPVRVDEFLPRLCEQLQVVAEARGVSLECGQVAAMTISSDPDRLRRLFFNLLDNALKYTPEGGRVRLSAGLREKGDEVEVLVEDNGIGIAPEHHAHLFERFFRVDPSRSRINEGTGLGLAICRSIVEAHRGRIEIDSSPGKGTRVRVVLPILAETPAIAAVEGATERDRIPAMR